jgi:hypothetical protein
VAPGDLTSLDAGEHALSAAGEVAPPTGAARVTSVGTARYEIRVRGTVSEAVLGRFEGFEAEIQPDETVFRGPVRDQAELHGLLARIESLGLELVEVKQLEGRARPAGGRSKA